MRVDLFDFDLPDERIALRPAEPARQRAPARRRSAGEDGLSRSSRPRSASSFLRAGDALVFNDTKVIPAQLEGIRHREGAGGQQVSATLHMRIGASRWKAFAKPGKRIKIGDRIAFGHGGNSCLLGQLDATVEEKGEGGEVTLAFDLSGPALDEAIHVRRAYSVAALYRRQARRKTSATAPITRRSTPARRAPSPRRRPACISRPTCSRRSTQPASSGIS